MRYIDWVLFRCTLLHTTTGFGAHFGASNVSYPAVVLLKRPSSISVTELCKAKALNTAVIAETNDPLALRLHIIFRALRESYEQLPDSVKKAAALVAEHLGNGWPMSPTVAQQVVHADRGHLEQTSSTGPPHELGLTGLICSMFNSLMLPSVDITDSDESQSVWSKLLAPYNRALEGIFLKDIPVSFDVNITCLHQFAVGFPANSRGTPKETKSETKAAESTLSTQPAPLE